MRIRYSPAAEKEDDDRQGSIVITAQIGSFAPYGKIVDGKCRRYEPYRAQHEAGGRLYGDSRGEIAYRYPMDHDYGERKR